MPAATEVGGRSDLPPPSFRRLRVYAFDPSLALDPERGGLDHAVLRLPYEPLEPGPVGEYLEVLDVDPASGLAYAPVDLDHPHLLAQDGLEPAEGEPRFHQQMVYAVAMRTIGLFERALGRPVQWAPHIWQEDREDDGGPKWHREFVRRLRCHPHGLRAANAYYSPGKQALLFGYFRAADTAGGSVLPGGTVFTCLAYDIVAHETTHAVLDGLHRRFVEASNPDVLAFHEAFADATALLQRFTMPEVLEHEIARTGGDITARNLLVELGREFGLAIGGRGALRVALTEIDPTTGEPDPTLYERIAEPHARGAVLLRALFDAFFAIYRLRTRDLLEIAGITPGSGPLTSRSLVRRLAREAGRAAEQLLMIAIRALDYCPPVDVSFGDYLRALVTADVELVTVDDCGYRLALIDAFRRRRIYPRGVHSLAVESLLWDAPDLPLRIDALPAARRVLGQDRHRLYRQEERDRYRLWSWLHEDSVRARLAGPLRLALDDSAPRSIDRSPRTGLPKLEVHSVRPTRRIGPNAEELAEYVIELTQKRRGYADPLRQRAVDQGELDPPPEPDFWFRGGVTLIVDLDSRQVRYAIFKNVLSDTRLARQRGDRFGAIWQPGAATYFDASEVEAFSALHLGG